MPTDALSMLNTIKTGITDLAQGTLEDYVSQVESDAKSITDAISGKIESWKEELISGDLTPDDVAFLIKGNSELMAINALTQAGIAKIELDKFKEGVVNIIVNTLQSAIKV